MIIVWLNITATISYQYLYNINIIISIVFAWSIYGLGSFHHVYPSLTRHEILYNKSYYNKIKTNKYYIKIDNVYDLLILFKLAIV